MPPVIFDLAIRGAGAIRYADASLIVRGSAAPSTPVSTEALELDPALLLSLLPDTAAYGRELTRQVLGRLALRRAWDQAQGIAHSDGSPFASGSGWTLATRR